MLIKCPECGREISDNAEVCPNCGYPVKMVCEKEEDDQLKEIELPKTTRKTNLIKKICIIVSVVIIVGLSIGLLINREIQLSNNKKLIEQQEKEVQEIKAYNRCIKYLTSVYSNSLAGAEEVETVCNLVQSVWYNSIYEISSDETEKYILGTDDFNDALSNVYADEDINKKLSSISDYQDKLDDDFNNLQSIPVELEKAYDVTVEVNAAFKEYARMALNPSGSYNSYSTGIGDKEDVLINACNTLRSVMPNKKEIPLYKNGSKINDELAFVNYLDQMDSKLPETAENKLYGFYDEKNAEFLGYNGTIRYYVSHKKVYCIEWFVSSCNDTMQKEIIDYLTNRYGNPKEGKENIQWTKNKELEETFVGFAVTDEGLGTITWISE